MTHTNTNKNIVASDEDDVNSFEIREVDQSVVLKAINNLNTTFTKDIYNLDTVFLKKIMQQHSGSAPYSSY